MTEEILKNLPEGDEPESNDEPIGDGDVVGDVSNDAPAAEPVGV